jgi:hypothetical protein
MTANSGIFFFLGGVGLKDGELKEEGEKKED